MKTEFPILPLSPTQWVLADKTRLPKVGEWMIHIFPLKDTIEIGGIRHSPRDSDYTHMLNHKFHPILAAYPKIEGVLLLPSLLWEKKNLKALAHNAYMSAPEDLIPVMPSHFEYAFGKGYEAAGGYTREQMIAAFNAAKETDGVRNLHCKAPNEHLTYGIEIIKKYDTAEDFLKTIDNPSPRALEIDVNEDGSIPSDNGVIIYTKPIY